MAFNLLLFVQELNGRSVHVSFAIKCAISLISVYISTLITGRLLVCMITRDLTEPDWMVEAVCPPKLVTEVIRKLILVIFLKKRG